MEGPRAAGVARGPLLRFGAGVPSRVMAPDAATFEHGTMIGRVTSPPALSTLAAGIGAATHRFDDAAKQVAVEGPDADGMVGMLVAREDVQACAAGFRLASDTTGALIDFLA
jgi:hypothetical protein